MILLSPLTHYLRQLRGSRGFGIHSPFAFEFALNVMRDRYPFYAYAQLKSDFDRTARAGRPSRSLVKLMFRISARLCLQTIDLRGNLHPLLIKAVKAPHSSVAMHTAGKRLIVVAADCQPDNLLIDDIVANNTLGGSTVIINNKTILPALDGRLDHGATFDAQHGVAVIVGHRHLPLQHFLVRYS